MIEFDPRRSPFDDIRGFLANASAHDANAQRVPEDYRSATSELLFEEVYKNVGFLIGREVIGNGNYAHRLDREIAEEHGTGFVVLNDMPQIYRRGIYKGLDILPVVMEGEIQKRVVHRIEERRKVTRDKLYHDEHYNLTFFNLCAKGALIIPAEPVDAHSVEDVESTKFPAIYDQILTDNEDEESGYGFTEKFKAIAEYLNSKIAEQGHEFDDKVHQKISWFNAQNLINGRNITAKSLLIGNPGIKRDVKELDYAVSDQDLIIKASNLTVAERYHINPRNDSLIFTGQEEIYVYGVADGKRVMVSAEKITSID